MAFVCRKYSHKNVLLQSMFVDTAAFAQPPLDTKRSPKEGRKRKAVEYRRVETKSFNSAEMP